MDISSGRRLWAALVLRQAQDEGHFTGMPFEFLILSLSKDEEIRSIGLTRQNA